MIIWKKGNLLESKCDALVNATNCAGIWGKGIALAFREKFPIIFEAHKKACELGNVEIGKVWVNYEPYSKVFIFCFPTKKHWRNPSQYEWIDAGLIDLSKQIEIHSKMIKSIALPPLGCGLGNLDWGIVKDKLINWSENHKNLLIEIYEP